MKPRPKFAYIEPTTAAPPLIRPRFEVFVIFQIPTKEIAREIKKLVSVG